MSTVQLQHNITSGLGILWEALLFKVFINVLYKYVGGGEFLCPSRCGKTGTSLDWKNSQPSGEIKYKHQWQTCQAGSKKNTLGTTSWEGVTVCKGPLPPK